MDIDSRKDKIIELLAANGKVRVTELAELFGVSEVTVRMDLADLEERGLLSRVHGGAMSSYKTYYNMSLQQRLGTNHEKKVAIAGANNITINSSSWCSCSHSRLNSRWSSL